MAAYAYTATVHQKTSKKMGGFPGMILVSGVISVTNYNGTTPAAIVEITSKFKGPYAVMLENQGTGAQVNNPSWDATAGTIRFTVGSTGAQLADNSNPSTSGTVHFIAIGPGSM